MTSNKVYDILRTGEAEWPKREGRMIMDAFLKAELERSLYVHFPLRVQEERGTRERLLKKEVEKEICLWNGDPALFAESGRGSMEVSEGILRIRANCREEFWPETENQNGVYATFGDYTVSLNLGGIDLTEYNQLSFEIRADCDGVHSPMIRIGIENDGAEKVPDPHFREGFHTVSVNNGEWSYRVWPVPELPRDRVTKLFFRIHKYGKELSASDEMRFSLKNIRMQRVKRPPVTRGWQCEEETASYSTSGYWREGKKTAIVNTAAKAFCLVEADTGRVCLEKAIRAEVTPFGTFGVMDFSEIRSCGEYRLQFGEKSTEPFPIGDGILEGAIWRMINFLFCERCGFPVPGKHGTCHQDVVTECGGLRMVYAGGWHDAADTSQQTAQTAEIACALMECAASVKEGPLYYRLMEEAGWGMDFVLRTRLGDGYRAASAGHRRWTDNRIGNFDDVPGRCHRNAFDNYLMAGVEAVGAAALETIDPQLSWKCAEAAREDFFFAEEVFEREGILRPCWGEHTYHESRSQHYAAAVWAGAKLCAFARGEEGDEGIRTEIRRRALSRLERLLLCQDRGETGTGISGFFYRDEEKRAIVHFSHQSREHLFAQALLSAAETFGDHPDSDRWREAAGRYGSYLKKLMEFASPYGMIPSGLYCRTETEDRETFDLVHPMLDFEKEREHYGKQLENGIPVKPGYFIRQFPVWFSYRGNNAILLSMARSASLLGKALSDPQLLEIAREQMYWIAGKNPFGNSFIYGEGFGFGEQYTALAGEMAGAIPVGTQTRGDEDIPCFPMGNVACHREVWTTVAGRWLGVAADLAEWGRRAGEGRSVL